MRRSRRRRDPPPWVLGPDCNETAHAVMSEAIERMDGVPLDTPFEVERRHETFELLAEAATSLGIPVVRPA